MTTQPTDAARTSSGGPTRLRCDNLGCNESHPLDHPDLGEEWFGTGRWLGWVYLDLNRPDLVERTLRFCSVCCLEDWIIQRRAFRDYAERISAPLAAAMSRPFDETARRRAGLGLAAAPSAGDTRRGAGRSDQ